MDTKMYDLTASVYARSLVTYVIVRIAKSCLSRMTADPKLKMLKIRSEIRQPDNELKVFSYKLQ